MLVCMPQCGRAGGGIRPSSSHQGEHAATSKAVRDPQTLRQPQVQVEMFEIPTPYSNAEGKPLPALAAQSPGPVLYGSGSLSQCQRCPPQRKTSLQTKLFARDIQGTAGNSISITRKSSERSMLTRKRPDARKMFETFGTMSFLRRGKGETKLEKRVALQNVRTASHRDRSSVLVSLLPSLFEAPLLLRSSISFDTARTFGAYSFCDGAVQSCAFIRSSALLVSIAHGRACRGSDVVDLKELWDAWSGTKTTSRDPDFMHSLQMSLPSTSSSFGISPEHSTSACNPSCLTSS
ncbi:uncharacterized protein IWZ02DRAFT_462389 [Phyllosticta citriasiana]|uniref:uncharacterized protein n=1 Tax=Phyllosticta citriasiana TaxID=595635 RepID=UPI0030FD85C1